MELQALERARPSFGTLLRRYRLAAGLTQEELAERARLSRRSITAMERGTSHTPRRDTLELLAEALALPTPPRMPSQDAAPNSKWKFHAYIITRDANSITYFRGGPRVRAGKRIRACLPFVGCTGYWETPGLYLTTQHGPYTFGSRDWNPNQNPKKRIAIANPGDLPCSYYNEGVS